MAIESKTKPSSVGAVMREIRDAHTELMGPNKLPF